MQHLVGVGVLLVLCATVWTVSGCTPEPGTSVTTYRLKEGGSSSGGAVTGKMFIVNGCLGLGQAQSVVPMAFPLGSFTLADQTLNFGGKSYRMGSDVSFTATPLNAPFFPELELDVPKVCGDPMQLIIVHEG